VGAKVSKRLLIMNRIIENLKADLLRNADEKTKLSGERFFKEDVKLYGIRSASVGRISKEHFKAIEDKNKLNIFALCDELWRSGMMEESFIACNWSYFVHKQFEVKDFEIFENWVRKYITNWASCDTFCNHTVGTIVEMYPGLLTRLKKWAESDNRWVKRASAVSLIVPARKGKFLPDIFEIADILHLDNDDMVQKGYGWMLKSASKEHQKEVFDYVVRMKKTMPRTSLRYAIEKMPMELKAIAMAK
jgi:3-methyladenine DNA glycosylase AlkD